MTDTCLGEPVSDGFPRLTDVIKIHMQYKITTKTLADTLLTKILFKALLCDLAFYTAAYQMNTID